MQINPNIPEGATHIYTGAAGDDPRFYKFKNKKWYYWSYGGHWSVSGNGQHFWNSLTPLYQNKVKEDPDAWHKNGEFPPAGTWCLIKSHNVRNNSEYVKVFCVGEAQNGDCVYQYEGSHLLFSKNSPESFKPLPAIPSTLEEMQEIFNTKGLQGLIDAGYKKE